MYVKSQGGGCKMAKGRPQTPMAEKALAGTLRADRINAGISFSLISELPPAPGYLSALAKKYFKDVCKMLMDAKMLYNSDVHLLAQMAIELSTYEEACNKLKTASSKVNKVGKDNYEQQSPWLGIRNNAAKSVREIGALFGLDPLSRTRFAPLTDEKEQNPFKDLM